MYLIMLQNNLVSGRGIERLLNSCIEILKETPEVSGLFYPEVEA